MPGRHFCQTSERQKTPDLVVSMIRMNTERPKSFAPLLAKLDNFTVTPRDQKAGLTGAIAEIFQQIVSCVAIPIPAELFDEEGHHVRQIGGCDHADSDAVLFLSLPLQLDDFWRNLEASQVNAHA